MPGSINKSVYAHAQSKEISHVDEFCHVSAPLMSFASVERVVLVKVLVNTRGIFVDESFEKHVPELQKVVPGIGEERVHVLGTPEVILAHLLRL